MEPTFQIYFLIGLILAALVLFSFEWVSADVVALGIMLILILSKILSPKEAFQGFGSDTVMMILGLLILTAALLRTGVVDLVGRTILRHTGTHPFRLLIVIMLASASLGAFMSNTASTAFFVPIVFGIAKRAKISASKLLMPLAFSSILSSSVTLISTSTNLVVSGLLQQFKMEPMGMFELTPVGLVITAVGLVYMMTIGRKLIPDRPDSTELTEEFGVRAYLTEILILPSSPLVGKTLSQSAFGRDLDLNVLRIVRDKTQYLAPRGETELQVNDVLLVEGRREEILKIKDTSGIEIKADVKLSDPNLQSEDVSLVEVILLPRSPLIGRTLKGYRFRERYGLQVLGINRAGQSLQRKISQVALKLGDLLLVQGRRHNISTLQDDNTFRILNPVDEVRPNLKQAPMAIAIFLGALAVATFKIGGITLPVAVLAGALLVFLTKCISADEAYREVEWKALILVACMLSLGVAMDKTGTAKYLAALITGLTADLRPEVLLSGFFVLTVILTQPMSNQAAAVVVLPIAIETAVSANLNPRCFAMMVAVAASCSYLTPLEPSCLMVYGPGRYRFADFLKVGSILTLLIYLVAILMVPRVWPLREAAGGKPPADRATPARAPATQ